MKTLKYGLGLLIVLFIILTGCKQESKPKISQQQKTDTSKVVNSTNKEKRSQLTEIDNLIKNKKYSEALPLLNDLSEKDDSNIYYKRGTCYFYLDNYQFALINFRKDRELNGTKHKKIDKMFDEMDNIFDTSDSEASEYIVNAVIKKTEEKESAVIKLYTSDNWKKRKKWFGYFNNKGENKYIFFDAETKAIQYVSKEEFNQEFLATFYVSYQEKQPIYSVNDSTTYQE